MSDNKNTDTLTPALADTIRGLCEANGLDVKGLQARTSIPPKRLWDLWRGRVIYLGDLMNVSVVFGYMPSDVFDLAKGAHS